MAKHMAPQPKKNESAQAAASRPASHRAQRFREDVPDLSLEPEQPTRAVEPGVDFGAEEPPQDSSAKHGRKNKKGGKRKKGNLLSTILIVVGLALLIVAGVIYFNNWNNYKQIDEENEKLAEYARLSEDDGLPPDVDWAALKAVNPDVVGWLQIPGTIVNYPVVQGQDNDHYLHKDFDGSDSIGGAVFMDYESTTPGMVDPQTLIYGHHMRNGSQFKPIADMDKQEVFDGVKTVWYVTEGGPYELVPLFVFYTNESDTDVRQLTFADDAEYQAYLKRYLDAAVAKREDADKILSSVKHTLTLSTCNYYDGYGRTLLVCAIKGEIGVELASTAANGTTKSTVEEGSSDSESGEEAPSDEGEATNPEE